MLTWRAHPMQDKWRNLNMDAHGSRSDKGRRAKGARAGTRRRSGQGAAGAQEPAAAAAGGLGRVRAWPPAKSGPSDAHACGVPTLGRL